MTSTKQHEDALRRAMLRDREAVEQLKKLDDAKSLLLNAVSHELRTPLASVVGFAETLTEREDQLSRDQRGMMLRRLVGGARRLERLLLNLFDLDRISRGILEPRLQCTEVDVLLHRVVENAELGGRVVDIRAEQIRATVDAGMVERIVENLLVNAVKHTPPRAAIRLELSNGSVGMLITVADDGPGVPDDLKERIFEPFQQGEIKAHSPGTGVGLSLVARFASLHGGEAWVDDVPGGGAAFRVWIPTQTGVSSAAQLPSKTSAASSA